MKATYPADNWLFAEGCLHGALKAAYPAENHWEARLHRITLLKATYAVVERRISSLTMARSLKATC